jgi:hypothetical protein
MKRTKLSHHSRNSLGFLIMVIYTHRLRNRRNDRYSTWNEMVHTRASFASDLNGLPEDIFTEYGRGQRCGRWRWEWHRVRFQCHGQRRPQQVRAMGPSTPVNYYCLLALPSSFISSQTWLNLRKLYHCLLPLRWVLVLWPIIQKKKHTEQEQRFLYSVSEQVSREQEVKQDLQCVRLTW